MLTLMLCISYIDARCWWMSGQSVGYPDPVFGYWEKIAGDDLPPQINRFPKNNHINMLTLMLCISYIDARCCWMLLQNVRYPDRIFGYWEKIAGDDLPPQINRFPKNNNINMLTLMVCISYNDARCCWMLL